MALVEPQKRLPGFRHFMGNLGPSPAQRFTLDGVPFDPSVQSMWERADVLMKNLAGVISNESPPTEFNPRLPSGYTYFLQIVAHDVVHSSMLVSRTEGQLAGLENVRRAPLRLETLYGGGPQECPHAYQKNGLNTRKRLRLGQFRENNRPIGHGNQFDDRDIGRARATELFDVDKDIYPEALISDPRNDSHAILSQMLVQGHKIHNAIVDWISTNKNIKPLKDDSADATRAFLASQALMILFYRYLIRSDLLPRILHPGVERAYRLRRVPILSSVNGLEQSNWSVPLEFSHGFFRFAHAMIRNRYTFNDNPGHYLDAILTFNSEMLPDRMPFERQWLVDDWKKRFFADYEKEGSNFSTLIGPWAKQPFGSAVGSDSSRSGNLMYRDLISSIATQPWSIGSLVDQIRPTHGELLNLSPLFQVEPQNGDRPWKSTIAKWLSERANVPGHELCSCDIDTLAADPPIPFFVRYEADHASKGKHLGVLGSIVVADVFYGIFAHDKVLGIDNSQSLTSQLSSLSKVVFDQANIFSSWSNPSEFVKFATEVIS